MREKLLLSREILVAFLAKETGSTKFIVVLAKL
jgi:hypothetical protein